MVLMVFRLVILLSMYPAAEALQNQLSQSGA